jgi:hypothetical protein
MGYTDNVTLDILHIACISRPVQCAVHPCAAHTTVCDPSSRVTRASFPLQKLTRLRCSYRFIVSVNPEKSWGKRGENPRVFKAALQKFAAFRVSGLFSHAEKTYVQKLKNLAVPSFFVFVALSEFLILCSGH